ncbi:MAG: hydroxyacid dehydrogenase [Fusobacteriaceae bacterium]|jgi:D-3-phosphoglycerate dehydrogenase|nr:hydroxyacid dehydrogenase [Fusobacteriaceae bacterium]
MKPKVLLTYPLAGGATELLREETDLFIVHDGDLSKYPDALREAEGIVLLLGKITRGIIEMAPKLRVISNVGVGYDHIDAAAATEHGVKVAVSVGANARAVAEQTFALLLAVNRNIVNFHNETVAGKFTYQKDFARSFELKGKTMAIIGLGHIGREVAEIAAGFGMRVLGYDPFFPREEAEKKGWTWYADYHEMLPLADVLSLHVPLAPETRGMITFEDLKTMKKSAILINCARGGIVPEKDLARALNEGVIGGAGVDVYEDEPPKPDAAILHAKNIVCTPHSAAVTNEAMVNMTTMAAKACIAIVKGEDWPFVVN